jgi:hypothetical protein
MILFMAMSVGFTGPLFLSFGPHNAAGRCDAVVWFCILGFPIVPLRRLRIEPIALLRTKETSEFFYVLEGERPLWGLDLVATFLLRWVVYPGVVLIPLWLALADWIEHAEVAGMLNVLWMIPVIWLISRRHEQRMFGKERLSDPTPKRTPEEMAEIARRLAREGRRLTSTVGVDGTG